MTTAVAEQLQSERRIEGVSQGRMVWNRLRRKRLAMISLVVIVVIYGAGIFAPLVAPYSYRETDLDRPRVGPSFDHWLGTDILGRDMLSRAIYSARTTVVITFAVVITGSLVLGVGLGLLAGYRGGRIDMVLMRVGDIFAGLPSIMMLILINAALGERVRTLSRWIDDHTFLNLISTGAGSYITVFGALALFEWVGMARIIGQHLLPNVSNLVILAISVSLGGIAGTEIFLTWFGVGVQPPAASFGSMLFEAGSVRTFQAHPHLLLVPSAFVVALLFSFALLGEGLNDAVRGR